VLVDKQTACGPNETGFYVLKAGRFNGKPVNAGDVIWTPADAACRFDRAEVLRVRWLGTPIAGETTILTPPAPYNIKGGNVRIFLDGKSLAIDLLTIDAGVTVPPHKHDGSDEVIYMISGKCDATYGGNQRKLTAGDTLHMLAGTEHTVTVGEKLIAVQVYAPAGPEQRFKSK
jgi:quercetin dioxygenase-like cupin family protein